MTPDRDCEQLDAYLLGDLPIEGAARFESHIEVCTTCREGVDEQRWIDHLLQPPLRTQFEPVPQTVIDSVRAVAVRPDRRRTVVTYVLTTAAALLIAVGWLTFRLVPTRPTKSTMAEIAITDTRRTPANEPKSEGTFVATSDAIVVPLDSSSEDVTIVQVYPTTESERQWRLERTLSNISTKPNGG